MFKYNETWYKRLCKCWIILCFTNCDKNKKKLTDTEILGYINDEIDLSSIFNVSSTDKHSIQNDFPSPMISSIGDMVTDVHRNAHHTNVMSESIDNQDIIPYASTIGSPTMTPGMEPQNDKMITIVEMNINSK